MNRYFDIALNLASDRFSGERDKVIADALTRNVNYFNIVCSSLNELDFVKDLNDRYGQNSCFTLGVHPHNANELNGNTLKSLNPAFVLSSFLTDFGRILEAQGPRIQG